MKVKKVELNPLQEMIVKGVEGFAYIGSGFSYETLLVLLLNYHVTMLMISFIASTNDSFLHWVLSLGLVTYLFLWCCWMINEVIQIDGDEKEVKAE